MAVRVALDVDEIEFEVVVSVKRGALAVPMTVYPSGKLATATPLIVDVAVTVSAPKVEPAVREILATPLESVRAVAPLGEKVENPVFAVVNFTSAPATRVPALSRTVAERVAGAFEEMVLLDEVSVTFAALVVPVAEKPNALLVTIAPLTVAVAVTESAPVAVPGFSVMLAMPLTSVSAVAEAGKKVPIPVPAVPNVTTTPGSGVPVPFFNVALRSAGIALETVVVELVTTSVGEAATGVVVVPVVVVDPDEPDPPPPQAVSSRTQATAKKYDNERDEMCFSMNSPTTNGWRTERLGAEP